MNLLPIDLYLWLFPLVPFSLCWAGWGCGLRFRSAVLMCAPLSWGFFGRMSGVRAVHEARQQLISRGHSVGGPAEAGWQRGRWTYHGWRPGHWVVGIPEVEAGEVALTRNGRLVWIGGPSL